jgi:hypothetical protein
VDAWFKDSGAWSVYYFSISVLMTVRSVTIPFVYLSRSSTSYRMYVLRKNRVFNFPLQISFLLLFTPRIIYPFTLKICSRNVSSIIVIVIIIIIIICF